MARVKTIARTIEDESRKLLKDSQLTIKERIQVLGILVKWQAVKYKIDEGEEGSAFSEPDDEPAAGEEPESEEESNE